MSRLACSVTRTLLLVVVSVIAIGRHVFADTPTDSDLRFALLVTRHGVRSPLAGQGKALDEYAAQAWPKWDVPAGYLTPHGKKQMTLMGEYYRVRFVHEGLLSGNATDDARRVYFRSDSDERTIETARGLAAALVPGADIDPHARPHGALDPLFRAAQIPVGPLDRNLGVASVLGRIGGTAATVVQANRGAFATLEEILVGDSGAVPAGKTPLLSLKAGVNPGDSDHTVLIAGPLRVASSIVDVLMLEYGEGLPMDQVGWGRITPERLTEVMKLHSLYFELAQGSSYPATAQGSNLASHILASLQQAASGRDDPRALGSPDQKVVVVVGHDTNIANLGGLLGLNWWIPGTHRNPVLPGGALLFELRQRRSDHQFVVRVSYLSQTMDQMRNLTPLTLEQPPAIAPIFVPQASEAADGYAAPLPAFAAHVQSVVDPRFVRPDPN